jgi:hypothetical protein
LKKKKKRRRTSPVTSMGSSSYVCPSCFETVDTAPDAGGGEHQTYVEDCPLCCRPNVLHVTWDADLDAFSVRAERES